LEAIPGVIPRQDALRVFDAADLFAASQDKSKIAAPPKFVPVPDVPVDVVASDAQGTSVTAVVATQPATGGPGALTVLTVTVGPDGLAMGTATQQCALDFVPARLALVPADAGPQRVYVADGTPGGTPGGIGDGAVEVSVPGIPAIPAAPTLPLPACPVTRRLPASDPADSPRLARPLRSIALSPAFTNSQPPLGDGQSVAPGSLLLGVTSEDKALCTDHAPRTCPADLGVPAGTVCVDHGTRSCGRGRLVLISTNVGGQSAVLRAPPNALTASGAPPMVPLSPPSPAREVAFMVTGLRLVAGNVPTLLQPAPPLVGLASTEDGTTYLLDVVKRRFFNDTRDAGGGPPPLPQFTASTLLPAPTLQLAPADSSNPSKQVQGWLNPGVTRSAQWTVQWHGTMPRLESLSGNLSRAPGSPTISLRLTPGKSLAPWTSAPELRLGAPSACALPYPQCVGDFVRILSYSSRSVACAALGTVPAAVDVPIAAIDLNGQGMQLQAVPGFDPGPECFTSDVAAAVEVHAGTTTAGAWMVFEGLDLLGRVPTGAQFVTMGARFDYPLNADPAAPPTPPPARDVVVSFTVTGDEPSAAGAFFSFTIRPVVNGVAVTDTQTVTGVRDTTTTGQAGFAGPILVYSSAAHTDPVFFTALTGSNSLVEATPAQFGVANTASIRFFY
jgi:hypothetical protein